MSSEAPPSLHAEALGFGAVLMHGIAHIAPALGLLVSIQFTASFAGVASPLAYGLALVIVLMLGLSLTQLARHIPSAGGYYTYVSRTVHPRAGFLTAWIFFLYDPTLTALNLVYFGHLLQQTALSEWGIRCPWWAFFLVGLVVITTLVYRGIALSARVTIALALLEIAIVLALSVWSLCAPGPGGAPAWASFVPAGAPSTSGLWLGVVFSLFCFAGFESVAPLAEESADPRRIVPRAIMASIALGGAFYLFTSFAALRGWGTGDIDALVRSPESPLFAIARRLWSRAWVLVLVAVLNSVLNVCVACTTTSTRMFYAMARAGSLPGALAHVHPRFRTPTGAIWLQSALSLVVGLGLGFGLGPLNAFAFMGVVITLGLGLVYSAGNYGVFRFYRGEQRREYRPILHLVCPALSTAALVYTGYRSLSPWPAAPLCFAPAVVVAWVGIGGGLMGVATLRGRRARRIDTRHTAPL